MSARVNNLWQWIDCAGAHSFQIRDRGPRRIAFDVVSEGASIFVKIGGKRTLVAYGFGQFPVSFNVQGGCEVEVVPIRKDGATSIRLSDQDHAEAGWSYAESHTDVTPQNGLTVTPEVRYMMDTLQRNMLQREQALRAEFERRMTAASAGVKDSE